MTTPVLPARARSTTSTDSSFLWDDMNGLVVVTNGSAATIDIPDASVVDFPVGTTFTVVQGGAGAVTVTADGDATIGGTAQASVSAGDVVRVYKTGADSWVSHVDT